MLDNERIFANEAQNMALNEQSEKIEEDLHEAEKNRRMLESNADFAVDKENKQVKRWEKRLQKKAQRRRQKVQTVPRLECSTMSMSIKLHTR